jgi:hypothetical protein
MARGFLADEKRAAKWLAKCDTLILQKYCNKIYICDVHILVKVDPGMYNTVFRIASPRFIDLKDGQTVRANNKNELPTECTRYEFEKLIPATGDPVEVTPYKLEVEQNNIDLRICFTADGERVFLNDLYYSNLKCFNYSGIWFGTNYRTPVFSNFGADIAVMILPVNRNGINSKYDIYNVDEVNRRISKIA